MNPPPSTTSSPRAAARRALLTTVAALGALTAPVGLVAVLSGGTAPANAAEVRGLRNSDAVQFIGDTGAEVERGLAPLDRELDGLQGLVAQSAVETPLPVLAPPTPPTTAPPTTAPPTTTTTAPPPPPAPTGASGAAADPATWDRLAQCESGGNWSINTGNGYYGGLQFSASTWRSVGGTGLPHEASREVQIEMGQRLQARSGWGQWPHCTRKLGLR